MVKNSKKLVHNTTKSRPKLAKSSSKPNNNNVYLKSNTESI